MVEGIATLNAPELTIGRGREIEVVHGFLDRVAGGGASLVLSGPAGVGKSHLLRGAAVSAAAFGMAVHTSSGARVEASVRLAGLNQLLLPLRREFGHLTPPDSEALSAAVGFTPGPADIELIAKAVDALLNRISTARPVLLVIDDVHWLDATSAAVLSRVVQDLAGKRVGFLGSERVDLNSHFSPLGLPRQVVPTLGAAASDELVKIRFPGMPGRVRERLLAEAQGNPLLLVELAAALRDSQWAPGVGLPDTLPLNPRLRGVFTAQLAALPPNAGQLLLLAAVTTSNSTNGGASIPVAFSDSELDLLTPAVDARLVSIDRRSREVTFCHPLIQSTACTVATSRERRQAHRRLAARQPGSDRQAWHLAHMALDPDERLADELEQAAGRRLARGDGLGAVDVLRRSADLSPNRSGRARRLAEAAYLVGVELGRDLGDVTDLLTEARRSDPAAIESLPAAVAEACVLLNSKGDVDAAFGRLVSGVRAYAQRAATTDEHLTRALYTLIDVCVQAARPELWQLLDAELAGLRSVIPPLILSMREVLTDPSRFGWRAGTTIEAAVKTLDHEVNPIATARIAEAALLIDRAEHCMGALRRIADKTGNGGTATVIKALAVLSTEEFSAGRWERSRLLATQGNELSTRYGNQLMARSFELDGAVVAAARGEQDIVRDITTSVSNWAAPRGVRLLQLGCHRVRALAAIGRGDFEEAYRQATAVTPAGSLSAHMPLARTVTLDLVESAARTNRLTAAAIHVRAIQSSNVASLSPRLAMIAAAAAGIADNESALVHFQRALAVEGIERWPFDLARVQLVYGERLRRMRAPAEARLHLASAVEAFARLGADGWAARAAKELAATAPTKGSGRGFGLGSLTAQEREVAALAATGLTNKMIAERLFLSPRTVGAHLRHVFRKLEITSRTSLRDALHGSRLTQARPS